MKVADRHRNHRLGARLVATYPMGPVDEGATLDITVTFGFHGCCEVVDDPWFLAAPSEEAAAELGDAVQAGVGAGAGAGAGARVQRVARQAATASAPSP